MTVQEKVRKMGKRMNEMRKDEPVRMKQHCYSLLHDAVLWTGSRLDGMDADSLIGFIQLAALTVQTNVPDLRHLRRELLNLGFSTAPPN